MRLASLVAASSIQCHIRGHLTRKDMRGSSSASQNTASTNSSLPLRDVAMDVATTTIQSLVRGGESVNTFVLKEPY